MSDARICKGGCLCGAARFEAVGEPAYSGLSFCSDCRKASGGGSVGYMGYDSAAFRVSGETRQVRTALGPGRLAVRNFCPACGSLLFGGDYGVSKQHTVYAGALDDPSLFKPTHAIMTRGKPDWAALPEGLTVYEGMPREA
jgi:hypothetical protein